MTLTVLLLLLTGVAAAAVLSQQAVTDDEYFSSVLTVLYDTEERLAFVLLEPPENAQRSEALADAALEQLTADLQAVRAPADLGQVHRGLLLASEDTRHTLRTSRRRVDDLLLVRQRINVLIQAVQVAREGHMTTS